MADATEVKEFLIRFHELLRSKTAGREEWLAFNETMGVVLGKMSKLEKSKFCWEHGLDRAGIIIDGYLWAEKKAKEKHHETS